MADRICKLISRSRIAAFHHPRVAGHSRSFSLSSNDHDSLATKDRTLLYEKKTEKTITLFSSLSLLQMAFWSWEKGVEIQYPVEAAIDTWIASPIWSDLGLASSVFMTFLVHKAATRTIAKIQVVPGGEKVKLTTFRFFGSQQAAFEVPVSDIHALTSTTLSSSTSYTPIKVEPYAGYFILDPEGTIPNPNRFAGFLSDPNNKPPSSSASTMKLQPSPTLTKSKHQSKSKPGPPSRKRSWRKNK